MCFFDDSQPNFADILFIQDYNLSSILSSSVCVFVCYFVSSVTFTSTHKINSADYTSMISSVFLMTSQCLMMEPRCWQVPPVQFVVSVCSLLSATWPRVPTRHIPATDPDSPPRPHTKLPWVTGCSHKWPAHTIDAITNHR